MAGSDATNEQYIDGAVVALSQIEESFKLAIAHLLKASESSTRPNVRRNLRDHADQLVSSLKNLHLDSFKEYVSQPGFYGK